MCKCNHDQYIEYCFYCSDQDLTKFPEPNENHKQVMPQTIEAYKQLAQRDLELIEEQREEISKLKQQVNKLEQKVNKLRRERC